MKNCLVTVINICRALPLKIITKKLIVCWKSGKSIKMFLFSGMLQLYGLVFLICCYGFESCREPHDYGAEHIGVRGNELTQRGRAVKWVGMQFGVASQTSATPTCKVLSSLLCLCVCSSSLLLQAPTDGNTPLRHTFAAKLPPHSDIQITHRCLQEGLAKCYIADNSGIVSTHRT